MSDSIDFELAEQTHELIIAKEAVSLQSAKGAKTEFTKAIRKQIASVPFYLTGDVQVEVFWRMNHVKRYQTADRPDVDNILKPILDSLSGPHGILLDDCQVMSVYSAWHDWQKTDEEELIVKVLYLTGDTINRDSLGFVEIEKDLFIPLDRSWPDRGQAALLQSCQSMAHVRRQLEDLGFPEAGRYARVSQRYFHKSRIQAFNTNNVGIEKLPDAAERLAGVWDLSRS